MTRRLKVLILAPAALAGVGAALFAAGGSTPVVGAGLVLMALAFLVGAGTFGVAFIRSVVKS